MMMIPLPFLFSAAAVLVVWNLIHMSGWQNRWMMLFLCIFAAQEVLIGVRYGYGVDAVRFIQPFGAAVLAPSAYLAFRNPPARSPVLWHLIPLLAVLVSMALWVGMMDLILALTNLIYAGMLARLWSNGALAVSWAPINRIKMLRRCLGITIVVLLLSGLTDIAISWDFWRTNGDNIATIVGGATGLGVLTLIALFKFREKPDIKDTPDPSAFDHIDRQLKKLKLYSGF